jgi:hypothetical protein
MDIEKSDTTNELEFETIPEVESPDQDILSDLYEMLQAATQDYNILELDLKYFCSSALDDQDNSQICEVVLALMQIFLTNSKSWEDS